MKAKQKKVAACAKRTWRTEPAAHSRTVKTLSSLSSGKIVGALPCSWKPAYRTELGVAFVADSRQSLTALPDASIDLALTSPPCALHFKKDCGNAEKQKYVEWFIPTGFIAEALGTGRTASGLDEVHAKATSLHFNREAQ